jgi:hypothetical protein
MQPQQILLVLLCELHARRYHYEPSRGPELMPGQQEYLRGFSIQRLHRALERWGDLLSTTRLPGSD